MDLQQKIDTHHIKKLPIQNEYGEHIVQWISDVILEDDSIVGYSLKNYDNSTDYVESWAEDQVWGWDGQEWVGVHNTDEKNQRPHQHQVRLGGVEKYQLIARYSRSAYVTPRDGAYDYSLCIYTPENNRAAEAERLRGIAAELLSRADELEGVKA